MKHILIVYSSRNGQTEKIAHYMRNKLVREGFGAEIKSIEAGNPTLDPQIDGVIVGAPVYAQNFPAKLMNWVQKHRAELEGKPSALFTVSLNAADKRPECREADHDLVLKFVHQTRWLPRETACFAGALAYSHYGFFLRWIMRHISAAHHGPIDTRRDYELTDWKEVDSFLITFASSAKYVEGRVL